MQDYNFLFISYPQNGYVKLIISELLKLLIRQLLRALREFNMTTIKVKWKRVILKIENVKKRIKEDQRYVAAYEDYRAENMKEMGIKPYAELNNVS